jgi:hypothetical protein
LRNIVQRELAAGRRVLIVPLLISFGGTERGVRERLDGLAYTMAEAALMPDDRLVTWVLTVAAANWRHAPGSTRISTPSDHHARGRG